MTATAATQQHVEREEKREDFRQDAISAWNEYQTTGQHVPQKQADAWLAKLEAGRDAQIKPWAGLAANLNA